MAGAALALAAALLLRVPTSADPDLVAATTSCTAPAQGTKVTDKMVIDYQACRYDSLAASLGGGASACTYPTTYTNRTAVTYTRCRTDELDRLAAAATRGARTPTSAPTPSGPTPTDPTSSAAAPPPPTTTAPLPAPTTTAPPPAPTTTAPPPAPTTTAPPPSGSTCTPDNAYTSWNGESYDWTSNGSGSMGEYYVSADLWGADGTGMTQRSVFCSHTADGNSPYFYAEATTPASADGSVKSYPNAHLDFHHWGTGAEPSLSDVDNDPSTPNVLRSSFTHQGPGSCPGCSYDWAQEMWLNNYAVEVMIWTDWQTQHPSFADAALQDTVSINGHTWEVWRAVWGGTGTSRDGYIVFLPKDGSITHEDWNLLNFTDYLRSKGWLGSDPTLSSVTYGVEICTTAGATKRFDVTDFSVTPLPHLAY